MENKVEHRKMNIYRDREIVFEIEGEITEEVYQRAKELKEKHPSIKVTVKSIKPRVKKTRTSKHDI